MRARPDYQPDPDSECYFEQALLASAVLEQLRPIIGEDRVREMGADPRLRSGDTQGRHGSASRSLEETIVTCLRNIRRVRGKFPTEHHSGCLNLNEPLKERIDNKLREVQHKLKFAHAIVSIKWDELTQMRVEGHYGSSNLIVSAPYSYAKQIDAGLGQIANKLIGPYSDVEESPDGILTGRVEYAKMDKHHDWFVYGGFLAWMAHDECIKVKALGDDREKAERAARSSARREVLAALG
jgi:RNA binding exosome subunit